MTENITESQKIAEIQREELSAFPPVNHRVARVYGATYVEEGR